MKVITINILFDLDLWEQRRDLLVAGLQAEQADAIALQEVNLAADTATWLAETLGMPYISQVPFTAEPYPGGPAYGIAILSRHPFTEEARLDLRHQSRWAQWVTIDCNGQTYGICNGHYYWFPGAASQRMDQIKQVMAWLKDLPETMPIVAVGDFNAVPSTPEMQLMMTEWRSAYALCNGAEAEYTCPTPLVKRRRTLWKKAVLFMLNLWKNRTWKPWRGTLDYIFVNSVAQVTECRLILTEADAHDRTLYPSDHFGLVACLSPIET